MKKIIIRHIKIRDRIGTQSSSVVAIMSGPESKEYNTSFDRVRFSVKLLILQWKREINLH